MSDSSSSSQSIGLPANCLGEGLEEIHRIVSKRRDHECSYEATLDISALESEIRSFNRNDILVNSHAFASPVRARAGPSLFLRDRECR